MNTHREMPDTLFVLFGADGDLSQRMIVPAIYNLFQGGLWPRRFRLIAVDRKDYAEGALADLYRDAVTKHSRRGAPEESAWRSFAQCIDHFKLDIHDVNGFTALGEQLAGWEGRWKAPADRIFYLALPPSLFGTVAGGLSQGGLAEPRPRTRLVLEKPIGRDLDSFREINGSVCRHFEESQVYRIDHYMGKETVQNILAMRFANPIFEPIWNRRYVDHVAITVAEDDGVGHRAAYYDHAGALRDMVQNHLLQLLCLLAMEPPVIYGADDLRSRKMDVLHALRPITHGAVSECAARGQYAAGWVHGERVPAYRDEEGVDRHSNIETYAALKLHVDNWRWQGVPFYLRTGKRLADKVSEISIRFRSVPHNAFPAMDLDQHPARLIIRIQPQQGIVVKFMAKEPGFSVRLRPVDMLFSYEEAFGGDTPEAYETLLWDLVQGDATLFMRADQVEAAWRLLTPVLEVWEDSAAPDFPNYPAGTWGPEAAELLVARDGKSWLTPATVRPADP